MNQWKSIRRKSFSKAYVLDEELMRLAKQESSHAFIANPSALLIYTYLVNYIKDFSQHWFHENAITQILDWGCGKGHVTFLLQKAYSNQNTEIISCDVDSSGSAHGDSSFLQTTPIIRTKKIDVVPLQHIYKMPFEDSSFDVVLSMGVLEHVPQDINSLIEINRILKPSGLLFCFFLPYQWSWTQRLAHWRGNYYHDRLYGKRQVKRMLANTNYVKYQFFMELMSSLDFVQVKEDEGDTKKEITVNLEKGFQEMKLYQEGKVKGTPLTDFLREL